MKELIDLVNEHLDEYLQISYPEDIFKAMKYTLMLPGKRLRPVMCLETARLLGADIKNVLPAACAIEMLHVQSLIHDDLPCMDNDDFRRGKPSNHKVFGEANAVLAGDANAKAVIDEYIGYLACGLVNIINIFQPDILCIGGGMGCATIVERD